VLLLMKKYNLQCGRRIRLKHVNQETEIVGKFIDNGEARAMFTPEFSANSGDEFTLVSNHNFAPYSSLEMSIAFNRARIAHARKHFPNPNAKCMLVYDLRGQVISEFSRSLLRNEFAGLCELKLDI
jgi:hypothetical protein